MNLSENLHSEIRSLKSQIVELKRQNNTVVDNNELVTGKCIHITDKHDMQTQTDEDKQDMSTQTESHESIIDPESVKTIAELTEKLKIMDKELFLEKDRFEALGEWFDKIDAEKERIQSRYKLEKEINEGRFISIQKLSEELRTKSLELERLKSEIQILKSNSAPTVNSYGHHYPTQPPGHFKPRNQRPNYRRN